jgi:hypothetical protein
MTRYETVNRRPVYVSTLGIDRDCLAVADAGFVFAGSGEHRDVDAELFHLVVPQSGTFEQIGSRLFEPADLVRMMDDAHLVRFVILGLVE